MTAQNKKNQIKKREEQIRILQNQLEDLRKELSLSNLNNEMAGGIMEELREVLTEFPCYHKEAREQCVSPPMLFAEGFVCHINWGREQSYWECIYALRNMPEACSIVYSQLMDKKEGKHVNEVERVMEDRGIRE